MNDKAPFLEKRFLPCRRASRDEKEQITTRITENLSKRGEILFAYIHGSFVTEGSFRDIDIAVFLTSHENFHYESDISYELSKSLGYEVEVRIINRSPAAFRLSVLKIGKLLFSKNEVTRTDFIENTGKEYREYAHLKNLFTEAVRAE